MTTDLDSRRKRARFRCWHRGTKELDLLLGPFADRFVGQMGEKDLDDLETLLEAPDSDTLSWITGNAPVPDAFATPLMERLKAFHSQRPGR